MSNNAILEELYAIRRQIMAEHGDDLADYLRAEFDRLRAAGHPIADIKQRRIGCTQATTSRETPEDSASSPSGR